MTTDLGASAAPLGTRNQRETSEKCQVGSPLRLGLVFSGVLGFVAGPSGRKWTENGVTMERNAEALHGF
ncbi:hypothetical protein N7530_011553 [Penicillium desertorum]|uniref:Uncharacterized protein n=1 Tax=Penicillium desertorum TaxID=1303715 RepID=A0A9W9WE99_9EURO|nr:hypothetical protein N7530_011553 [Penicillium desertorum]